MLLVFYSQYPFIIFFVIVFNIISEYSLTIYFIYCHYLLQLESTRGKLNLQNRSPEHFWERLQLAVGTEEDVHIRREVSAVYMYSLCAFQSCDYCLGAKVKDSCFHGVTSTS